MTEEPFYLIVQLSKGKGVEIIENIGILGVYDQPIFCHIYRYMTCMGNIQIHICVDKYIDEQTHLEIVHVDFLVTFISVNKTEQIFRCIYCIDLTVTEHKLNIYKMADQILLENYDHVLM